MVKKLKKLLITHKALWLALLIFFAGTFTFLDTGKHFSFNLEPYPDGLFYTVPAWNFVHGQGFVMKFANSIISPTVPVLYSWLLVPFYFLFPTAVAFYFLNVLLGTGTLIFLYLLFKEKIHFKNSHWLLSFFAISPVFLWLVAVPMAENLLLFLITVIIWFWQTNTVSLKKKVVFLPILQALLFLTKYASFNFIIPFNIIFLFKLWKKKKISAIKKYFLSSIGILVAYLLIAQPTYLLRVFQPQEESKTETSLVAFSIRYFPSNILVYSKMLLGIKTYFLWKKISFVIPGLILIPIFALSLVKKTTSAIKKSLFLIFGIIGLQSFFYALDARYIIAVLPLFFLVMAQGWSLLLKNKKPILPIIILGILTLITLISQKTFYKELLGSNWFHRSSAWQYEAILQIKKLDLPTDSYLITALPPYLFNFYYPQHPHLLPLSKSQEFMNENQRPWGTNLNYDNLAEQYQVLLTENKKLYISNSYITHLPSVITDFENYKQEFNLQLISEGCEQACNVYQLMPIK